MSTQIAKFSEKLPLQVAFKCSYSISFWLNMHLVALNVEWEAGPQISNHRQTIEFILSEFKQWTTYWAQEF